MKINPKIRIWLSNYLNWIELHIDLAGRIELNFPWLIWTSIELGLSRREARKKFLVAFDFWLDWIELVRMEMNWTLNCPRFNLIASRLNWTFLNPGQSKKKANTEAATIDPLIFPSGS